MSVTLATTSICNTDKIPAYVEFLTEFGDLPIMTSVTDSLIPLTLADAHIVRITEAQKGNNNSYDNTLKTILNRFTC